MKINIENSKQIMDAYMPLIIANARKFSAFEYEEAVDQSKMILLDAILEYEKEKGSFGNFLKQKLYFYFLDECKKGNTKSLDELDNDGISLINSIRDDYDLEKDLENKQKYKNLYKAINTLPANLKSIIVGKYFLDMTNDDLAKKMNLTYKTIANKSSIALKLLRKTLEI